ncbi:polycystic kidney disease protein 1-like 2, partial [Plakobranchus ocellatus]
VFHLTVLDNLGGRTTLPDKFYRYSTYSSRDDNKTQPGHVHPEPDGHSRWDKERTSDGVIASSQLYKEANILSDQVAHSKFTPGSNGLLLPLTILARKLNQLASRAPCNHTLPFSKVAPTSNNHQEKNVGGGKDAREWAETLDPCQKRAISRKLILASLEYMPLRDEVEVSQALRCLLETTAEPHELDEDALFMASIRLREIREDALGPLSGAHAYGNSWELNPGTLRLTVEAVSNLLRSSTVHQRFFNTTSQREAVHSFYITVIDNALETLNDVLQAALRYHSIGERPLFLQAELISVNASHYSLSRSVQSSVQINGVAFHLPQALKSTLLASLDKQASESKKEKDKHSAGRSDDHERESTTAFDLVKGGYTDASSHCFQTRAISFSRHPFSFVGKESDLNMVDPVFKQQYGREVNEIKIQLSSHSFKGGRRYHIGLVEASFNSGRRRSTEVQGRNYTLHAWHGTCLYWNTSQDGWCSDGCHVMPSSSVDELHCSCNHLTTFGSHFDLISTALSYTSVDEFFFSLHENPLVVILVSLLMLIYIVMAMVLSPSDAQDTQKDASTCVYLQDNATSHHQKYEVALETGFCRHAGTTSKISIILHGEEGMSETRELMSDDNRPMFEANSRDRFILTLPESLGRIQKIQLWHNNCGTSPGWYLRQAVVRDLNTGQAAYFLCQRWLAVDRDDGKVEREFTSVEGRNITFNMIFWLKGSQYLSDFHTWMSVLTRPPHSRFTRVQRLTVCLTLLSAYMCLSAIWFKQTPQKVYREFGLLDLSWHNIVMGFICCLIVLPLNLFLGFLFRRSRIHYPGYERDRALLNNMAKPGGAATGDLSEGEEETPQTQMTHSILDQSILNWQNIQDWAQKQWLKRQHSVRSSANSVKTSQTSPQLSAPSTTPLVQTLLAEYDTDHASSAWDTASRVAAEKYKTKACSDDSSSDHVSDILNTSRRIFLPFWCRYLAWILCLFITCASITITVMYGFRFSHTKSVMWIQSVYFSFIACFFIVQPLLIVLRVLYTSVRHRKNVTVFNHYEDGFYGEKGISGVLNKQHSFLGEEDEELQRGVAARSRSRYLRFAGPPQEKQLKSSRKRQIRQKRALLLVRNLACFLVMFLILITISFGKDTRSPYMRNLAIKQALTTESHNGMAFNNLKSPNDWYNWNMAAIINSLYSQALFSGEQQEKVSISQPNESKEHPLSMSPAWLGHIVGQIQLRQLRGLPAKCLPKPYFRETRDKCLHHESIRNRNDSDFLPSKNNTSSLQSEAVRESWLGPGIVKLDRSRDTAAKQLKELEESGWIDKETQAVFVEMTLYNAPTNLFSSVTLLMEIDPLLGNILTSEDIMSTNLFRYSSFFDHVILGCELLFVVITLWMIFREMQQGFMLGRAYFFYFWNYIQVLMCAASLLYILVYIFRYVLITNAVESMRSTFYEEFISISFICFCDQLLRDLVAVVFFCVIVKSVKILHYHQVFWRFQTVYRRCRREIFLAGLLYIGLMLAFACLATGLFQPMLYSLRSIWCSLLTMSALSVRVLDWPEEMDSPATHRPVFAMLMVFGYTFLHGFTLTYIFTVLTQRLKKTRKSRVLALTGRQLVSFYWKTLLQLAGLREEPSVDQTDNTLPAEFTMAEILYLVEELLFRMNAVLGTCGLPDKHHSFSDSDTTPNCGEDGMSSGGSMDQAMLLTDHADFLSEPEDQMPRLEQRLQKIEDKLCSQEPYLAQLLKLDSIGADILSEEKEHELRSHLEFEIFQQLQMQRHDLATAEATNTPYEAFKPEDQNSPLNVSGLEHIEEVVSSLLSQHSSSKAKHNSHIFPTKLKSNLQANVLDQQSTKDQKVSHHGAKGMSSDAGNPSSMLIPRRTKSSKIIGGLHQIVDTEGTKSLHLAHENARDTIQKIKTDKLAKELSPRTQCSDRKDNYSTSTTVGAAATPDKKFRVDVLYKPDAIPKSRSCLNSNSRETDILSKFSAKNKQGLAVTGSTNNQSSGNASPQSLESDRGHKRTDSSSGNSAHERSDPSQRKPDLITKSTYARNMLSPPTLDTNAAGGSASTYSGWIPRPKQFKFLPELINPVGAESSSGSEQEVPMSRFRGNHGRRNLRKTKSRGKGKGSEGVISAPIDLATDFPSSGHSGGSDFDIIIHRVPSELDTEDHVLTEGFPKL